MVSLKVLSFLFLVAPTFGTPVPDTHRVMRAPAYMSVVNKYRTKLSLPKLTWDSKLEANAHKTCVDGNGVEVHQLIPPTTAQVLAPGTMDDFEKLYVGDWLCERWWTPAIEEDCKALGKQGDGTGQVGHADILMSSSYTHIGCSGATGVIGCDLR